MDTSRIPRPPVVVRDADAATLLTVYLQDHHAGSVGGIELAKRCAKSNTQEPLGGFLRAFIEGLQVSQDMLEEVMAHHGIVPSPVKSPLALVAERVGRAKLNGQLVGYSPLSRLVELEALTAGVETQHNLWRTLKALPAGSLPPSVDADERIARTQKQREELEEHRADAARVAFGSLGASTPAGSTA